MDKKSDKMPKKIGRPKMKKSTGQTYEELKQERENGSE